MNSSPFLSVKTERLAQKCDIHVQRLCQTRRWTARMCATERLCHTRKGGQTAQICATQGEVDKQHKRVPQKGCAIQGEVDERHEFPIRTG